jgi:CheY-like chemotaxis protein
MAQAKVLLVDDNPATLRILQSILQGLDCDVTAATDGADALLKARELCPELVVADFGIPIMDAVQPF